MLFRILRYASDNASIDALTYLNYIASISSSIPLHSASLGKLSIDTTVSLETSYSDEKTKSFQILASKNRESKSQIHTIFFRISISSRFRIQGTQIQRNVFFLLLLLLYTNIWNFENEAQIQGFKCVRLTGDDIKEQKRKNILDNRFGKHFLLSSFQDRVFGSVIR